MIYYGAIVVVGTLVAFYIVLGILTRGAEMDEQIDRILKEEERKKNERRHN